MRQIRGCALQGVARVRRPAFAQTRVALGAHLIQKRAQLILVHTLLKDSPPVVGSCAGATVP